MCAQEGFGGTRCDRLRHGHGERLVTQQLCPFCAAWSREAAHHSSSLHGLEDSRRGGGAACWNLLKLKTAAYVHQQ